MAVTRPPDEPAWCARTSHDDSEIGRHLSKEIRVGNRRDRGEVAAWLERMGHGPTWVSIVAAHMAACTVEITLEDAAELRDGLTELLELAGVAKVATLPQQRGPARRAAKPDPA